jgi:hypothetical protein
MAQEAQVIEALEADPQPAVTEAAASVATGGTPKSQTVVVNLINRMVERGLLTKEDASDLIKQAEEDADVARQQAVAAREQAAMAQAAAEQASSVVAMLGERANQGPNLDPIFSDRPDETVRVTYIPEHIRTQMRDEIRQDVMDQAKAEKWAAPGAMPEWTQRFRLFGDIRARYEGIKYPEGNDNTGSFPDFNAINTGAAFDIAGNVFSPQLNADKGRDRVRLRVRVGAEVTLADGFSAGLRVATGSDNSPVTTNQTLGGSGNFGKYAIWLDRGYLKYETGDADQRLALSIGRFDNPFFSSEVMWDDDLGFDGVALEGSYRFGNVTPFAVAGAFPVYNTSLNYATNQPAKFDSYDKWLYGFQAGVDWKLPKDLELKLGIAYYEFENIEGVLSDPFTPLSTSDAGNTDASRPAFAQKGNTYRALRNIVPSALNNYGTLYQYQYFGLATPFRVVALTGKLDYNGFEPIQISLAGEFIKNLAFNSGDMEAIAINNRGPITSNGLAPFEGGDTAWIVGLKVGNAALQKRWDWRLGINYRYVESDAVVDGFTDSDFGGGGTNVKGFSIFGNLALSKDVWLGARWMSADEIAGPPLKVDIFQIDISAKF